MPTKLSLLYIETKSWYEAKVILQEILRDSIEHSFAWRYLGLVLTRLGEYDEAEKALTRANLLDVENPTIWAYFTIFCLNAKRRNQALESLNELHKVNFRDIALLKEIAFLFKANEDYVISANLYKKILEYVPDDAECYLNIAEMYYDHIELNRKMAIDVLKEGLYKVKDEDGVRDINNMIRELQIKEDKIITLGNNDNVDIKEEDDLNLTGSSHIKAEDDFFKDEDMGEEEKNKSNFDNDFN
jgi:tetratricopeptide (TPR) repeat protein